MIRLTQVSGVYKKKCLSNTWKYFGKRHFLISLAYFGILFKLREKNTCTYIVLLVYLLNN